LKPETLAAKLHAVLGDRLQSVVLYGSAAAGDHVGKGSDYNILVVATELGVGEFEALAKPSAAWQREGNPPPLYFTFDRLRKSADVFPIELMDIRDSRRVLYGDDVVAGLEIRAENLRLVLEREFKSTLIQLGEGYLLSEGKPKRVRRLMVESLSTVLVLMRGALRLFESEVPVKKIPAMQALRAHIDFDSDVFLDIEALKEGRAVGGDMRALFERYLKTVESVVDAVDAHVHSGSV
jgi:predicted nucleotidyltransferase